MHKRKVCFFSYIFRMRPVFCNFAPAMSKHNLSEGSLAGAISSFALPYMLAYLLQILYGLGDLFVIGLYCDVDATTAVSNAAQVMYLITNVIIGLAMGNTVCMGRAIGARDQRRAAKFTGNTITMFLLLSVVLGVALFLLRYDIVELIRTPPTAVEGAVAYLSITFAGIPFIIAYNVIASIFRGLGDSLTPMYFVGVACVVNIGLDFLFIGGLGLGPAGAALGTVLSQLTSVVIAIAVMRRHHDMIPLRRSDLRMEWPVVRQLLGIGTPVACQDGLIQVGFIIISIIANMRGITDAAAVGIVEKFIGLLFVIPSSMLATVSAVSAQSIGAGKMDRARKAVGYGICVTAGAGLVWSLLFQFVPELAVGIFTDDAGVIASGSDYLRSYVWDCMLAGVHFCFSGFFTACGLSVISFTHNFLSLSIVRIPLSYYWSVAHPETLYYMGWASPAGSAFSIVFCTVVWLLLKRRQRRVPQI